MIGTKEKRDRSVEVANPNLRCTGIEIQRPLFGNLGGGIRRRKNFDANLRCADENNRVLADFGSAGSQPGHIGRLDTIRSGHRALCNHEASLEQTGEERADRKLAAPMAKSRRRGHKDMAVPIGLDAVRELRKNGISQNLSPTGQVKLGLRIKIRKLDCDWHQGKYARTAKNA